MLSSVPVGCPTVLDGLAFGTLPEAGALQSRTPLIALVHQPLALDSGLDTAQADAFRETERAALAGAARVVVTSEATAEIIMHKGPMPANEPRAMDARAVMARLGPTIELPKPR